jgi:hypothetical protein
MLFLVTSFNLLAQDNLLIKEVISREVSIHVGGIQTPEYKEVVSRETSVFIGGEPEPPYKEVISREVSVVITTPQPPTRITQLNVSATPSGDSVTLSWNGYNEWSEKDVARYNIYFSTRGFTNIALMTPYTNVPGETFSITLNGLTPWEDHCFAVVPVDAAGGFDPGVNYTAAYPIAKEVVSRECSVFIGAEPDPPYKQLVSREVSVVVTTPQVPARITQLTLNATPAGESTTLSWSGYNQWAENDVARYDIYMFTRGFTNIALMTPYTNVPGETFSITLNGLPPWQDRCYAVVAVDAAGGFDPVVNYSAAYTIAKEVVSRETSVFIGAEPNPPYKEVVSREVSVVVTTPTAPAPVTGLDSGFTANGSTRYSRAIEISWPNYNEVAQQDVVRYRIYLGPAYFDDVTGMEPFGYAPAEISRWTVTGLSPLLVYHVAVVAVDALGQFNPVVRSVSAQASAGLLDAWGDNLYGQTTLVGVMSNAVGIAAGGYHSLLLQSDGSVFAWGNNVYGQSTVPPGLANVVQLAAGSYHSLALRTDGRVIGWGKNTEGQASVPSGLSNVTAIAASGDYSLALRADGTVIVWGDTNSFQVVLPNDLTNIIAIAAGSCFGLALRDDGTVTGWGWNVSGQATPPAGLSEVVAIACGGSHGLALKADGTLVAWGNNSYGQCNVPTGLTNVVAIAGSGAHSLALKSDGTIVAWGNNSTGQLDIPGWLTNTVAIAGGNLHSIALVGDGLPVLTVQPIGRVVLAGRTVQLYAGAVGVGSLVYQWQFNGFAIPGANQPRLTLNTVGAEQTGNYTCVVSNTLGKVTSRVARVEVVLPPGVSALTGTVRATLGTNITLSAGITGTPPFTYQWRKNGENITTATNATLSITNVQVTDCGSYQLAVLNAYGVAVSGEILLGLELPFTIASEDMFVNRRSLTGASGIMTGTNSLATREAGEPDHAGEHGSNSIWFTWQAPTNGIVTLDTVGSTFDTVLAIYQGTSINALTPVAADDDGGGFFTSRARFNVQGGENYEIAVDGFPGERGDFILTWNLEATGQTIPMIMTAPTSQTVNPGSNAWFHVSVVNGLSYQWYFNNNPIPSATGPDLLVTNAQRQQVGRYQVAITNSQGQGLVSLPVNLELGPVANVHSQDKLQSLLAPDGPGLIRKADGGLGMFSVAAGTIVSHIFPTAGSTTQSREPAPCSNIGGASRWFTVVAQGNGYLVLDTTGSDFDTVMMVFPGSIEAFFMGPLACDDNGAADGVRSRVILPVAAGQTLYVSVDGKLGVTGTAQLTLGLGTMPQMTNAVVPAYTLAEGASQSLNVQVQGVPTPTIQWFKDYQAIPGATNTGLTLARVQLSDMGTYGVYLQNWVGSQYFPAAQVTVQGTTIAAGGSHFAGDAEGWTVANLQEGVSATLQSVNGHLSLLGANNRPIWGPWSLVAPASYRGDKQYCYGGLLGFDLNQGTNLTGLNIASVTMDGAGQRLVCPVPRQPGTGWVHYQVLLHENGGWRKGLNGASPTHGEFLAVLGAVTNVQLESSAYNNNGGVDLDNFTLMAAEARQHGVLDLSGGQSSQHFNIKWADVPSGYFLEATDRLPTTNWFRVDATYDPLTGIYQATVPFTNHQQYLRLRKP